MKKNSYIKVKKQKNNIEIVANIENVEKIDKDIIDNDIKILSKLSKSRKNVNIITDIDLNENNISNNNLLNLVASLNICKIKDKNKRLEYIYMSACKYLDNEFINNNICGFKDDVCDGKRNSNVKNGCCRKFTNKILGLPLRNEFMECEFQKNKKCTADCLGCKLFSCKFVNDKGYKFTVYNVPLIRYYFNAIQKCIILSKLFTHKDDILKLLKIFNF